MKRYIALVVLILLLPSTFALGVELLSTNPSPAKAGEYNDVTIRITNEGENRINNVAFEIEQTKFIVPTEERISLSFIDKKESVTRTFRVFFADGIQEGTLNLPVVIYNGDLSQKVTVPLYIQEAETLPNILIGKITTTPNELLSDTDDNEIIVTVQNLGDKDAELVSAKLVSDDSIISPSYSFSMTDSIATIGGGEQENFVFTIDVAPTTNSEISSELQLKYRSKSGTTFEQYGKVIPFNLELIDSPYLVVENVTQISSFDAGSNENKVRLTIRNEGLDDAEEVRVRAVPDISYPFIFELTTEYVASKIKPGESSQVEFTIEVVGDAVAKEYPITVQLESLVGETRYTQDDTFSIEVHEGKGISVPLLGGSIIAVILIVSLIIGIMSRKK